MTIYDGCLSSFWSVEVASATSTLQTAIVAQKYTVLAVVLTVEIFSTSLNSGGHIQGKHSGYTTRETHCIIFQVSNS